MQELRYLCDAQMEQLAAKTDAMDKLRYVSDSDDDDSDVGSDDYGSSDGDYNDVSRGEYDGGLKKL